jgi:spore coat polysaccharide biosynthesis protein SpsF
VAAAALILAEKEAASPYEREHVCPYLYGRGEIFRLHRPLAPLPWQGPDMRLTVDTWEDYEKAQTLYRSLSDLPLQERGKGEAIISTYKKLFLQGKNP